MGIGRISSVGASGPVEGSGAAKPGPEAFLALVFPHGFLYFPLNPETVMQCLHIKMFVFVYFHQNLLSFYIF